MRARVPLLLVVVLVGLSGCSALDSGDSGTSGEFSESVEFAWAGVAGEDVHVNVAVENTGDEAGEYEATLEADGEEVTSETVELEPGATVDLTLAHAFEEPGEYDLAVGDAERTIPIHESPEDLFGAVNESDRETTVQEMDISVSGVAVIEGEEFEYQQDATATKRTNYTAETVYETENATIDFGGQLTDQTTEQWVVDGTVYEKTTDHSTGEVEYVREPSDEFEDDDTNVTDDLEEFLSTDHTAEEYVFVISAATPQDASRLMAALGEEPDADIPPDVVTSFTMEFHLDRGMGRPTATVVDMTMENYEVFRTFDMTIAGEIIAYDEPVHVEVPEEVRENAVPAEDS